MARNGLWGRGVGVVAFAEGLATGRYTPAMLAIQSNLVAISLYQNMVKHSLDD